MDHGMDGDEVPKSETTTQSNQSIFPVEILAPVLKKLPKHLLLMCREVCKTWKVEVDNFYATTATVANSMYFLNPETHTLEEDYGFFINSAERSRRFLQEMENHAGNPFPKRLITILKANDDNTDPAFWSSANTVLQKFGMEVWTFSFGWRNGENMKENCARLQTCLLLLPNLKRLCIGVISIRQDIPVNNDWTYDLWLFLNDNSLPYLPSLESIQFGPTASIPKALAESLLNIHPNVRRVSGEYKICTSVYSLPQLEDAALFISQPCSILLKTTMLWRPPLKKIYLYKSGFRFFLYEHVFKWLNRFSKTLREVELSCKWLQISHKVNCSLDLPNVTKFKLTCLTVESLPYIQSLPALEHLVLVSTSPSGWSPKEARVVKYLGPKTTRNIWIRLPTLLTVTFKGNVNNRGNMQSLNFNRATFLKHQNDTANGHLNKTVNEHDDDKATELIDGNDLDTQLMDVDDFDTEFNGKEGLDMQILEAELDDPGNQIDEEKNFKEKAESVVSDPAAP